jgi:predicted amidohydrolase
LLLVLLVYLRMYTPELFSGYASLGARIVFEAAAPGLYGSQETRDWQAGYQWWHNECYHKPGRYARDNSIYIAVATQAGRTRDEDFPGGGYVFGPDGKCLVETPDWSEGMIYAEIPLIP